jgi:hypothetical protein
LRALLEEYGYTIIAVFAATVMITVIIFSGIFPIMNEYAVGSIPEDVVKNEASKEALEECLEREAPTITAEDTLTFKSGSSVNLKQLVSATNADGNDISDKITFKFPSEAVMKYFDKNTGVFGKNGKNAISAGEYEIVVSVAEREYGKISQKTITIIVQ